MLNMVKYFVSAKVLLMDMIMDVFITMEAIMMAVIVMQGTRTLAMLVKIRNNKY